MTKDDKKPNVKEVLTLLGLGVFLAASIVIPTLPMAAKPIVDLYRRKQSEEKFKLWNKFNQRRLKHLLKRLYEQKVIEVKDTEEGTQIKLTEKGRVKFLKFRLEEMMLEKPEKWDGRWRIIIYDIKKEKRIISEIFRSFLRKLKFLKLQKSVYLTPYPCKDEIEFLRQYYGLDKEVLYLELRELENENVYKEYFNL